MADLELRPQIRQERREYTVAEIFRLAEKFRHLAQDLSEVFIRSSRQGIIHQVQTDPEEEELREELAEVEGLSYRIKDRRRRKDYKKPVLIKAAPAKKIESQKLQPAPSVAARVRQEAISRREEPVKQVSQTPLAVETTPKPAEQKRPPVAAPVSLIEAARGYNAQLQVVVQPSQKAPAEEIKVEVPNKSALQLSTEERPLYEKYADIAEQLLDAKQLPHFKTLLEKAKTELSPLGVELLEDLAKKKGF